MSKQFLPRLSREEQEAKSLADGIANGTILPKPEGSFRDMHLPPERYIAMADMLRAARLDSLARAFAIEASRGADRAALLSQRRYRDLRFHPRYKREANVANRG